MVQKMVQSIFYPMPKEPKEGFPAQDDYLTAGAWAPCV